MSKKKKDNKKDKKKPDLNPELEGFDLKVNEFGEIETNFDVDKINQFLNKNVDDKKLRDRDDKDDKKNEDKDEDKNNNKNKD